jgi:succinoglycan biosynthesis transport protein ExoP
VKAIGAASPIQILFKLFLKWWWFIAAAVALGAGAGYFIRTQQPNLYYAKASVLFGGDFTATSTSNSSWQTLQDIQDKIQIYAGLVRLPRMLNPVIQKLNLNLSVDQLNERMGLNRTENLPLLEITIADNNPVNAANIANAIAQEMIAQSPTERQSAEVEFKRGQLRDLAAQISAQQDVYNQAVAAGKNLTSSFEIAQNLDQQTKALANIRDLQRLYADMSSGLAAPSNLLTLFEPASPETVYVVSSSAASIPLSGAAGLVLSVATIVLLWFFDDRLQWQEGVEEMMDVRVIGPLGKIPRNKLPLYVETMPESIESEVLRQLRAKLVLAAGGEPPRVLTVTSYDSGDGKTVTASNMALSSAKAGLRTLLVDGDIRKGNLHEIFNLPNVLGLSDVLASHEDVLPLLSRALVESGYDNLTILTCGRATGDPAALLSSPRLAEVVNVLRGQFDAVILDSVPTIGGPDSTFLADASNGVLIVVHGQRTTRRGLRRTLQLLEQGKQVRILGMVFNRVPLQITSTYNQPYYRRNLSITPEQLNRELLKSGKRGGLRLKRNVAMDKSGNRWYSLPAAAIQLGLSEGTLKSWLKQGTLKAKRRGLRRWVSEAEIQRLVDTLPHHQLKMITAYASSEEGPQNGKGTTGKIPDVLRGKRDALLDFVREPSTQQQPEEDESSEA